MTDTTVTPTAVETVGRLQHFPIGFFSTVMGLAGFALATHRLEQLVGLAPVASRAVAALAAMVFVSVAALYLAKVVRHRAAVVAEWHHPVRLSFFPTVSISLLLLAVLALPLQPAVASGLWMVGTALHLYVCLAILSTWIGHRPFEPPHLNPAWFIPAVGNIVVPLAGVPLGWVEVSWFFFSFGILFWVVLVTLVFNRLIFHNPLPERLLPTLMILLAPPAIGFLAYLQLTGGALDGVARVFFYCGLGLFLLVATQAGRLVRLRFALSWWAYSFPLAALTTAAAVFAAALGGVVPVLIFMALYTLLCGVIAILVVATVRAIAAGEVCRPEP